MNTDEDWRREAADARDERSRNACQCFGEMPGRCPGPANCPMCETDEEMDHDDIP